MSTIDQRVVEMRFDNKQFESGVATTMSTLEKFKQSLSMRGATKGLETVSDAAKKCDMSALGTAVETVKTKFSALEVMGITALANITNSAVNAGKRIVSALTIDPIKSGFAEYETQINAVQTILANTSHAGTDLDDVNGALDTLNTYADKTIYNFTEMTRNIGTFTAAGLGLEESTLAIKGIANLAAVSGSTSQQASTAMYQLSQALANGTVNLQDWNSVVNAGMGGKVFQDALIRTASAMEGVTEETFRANNITGSFRESISTQGGTGWLTAEVLSKTLQQFTGDLSDAELAAMGFSKEQIKNIQSMAVTANDAATKVKTFTQLWDTLKEAAQSGWTQTWEIIVGDFEEAKEFLTDISDRIGAVLGASADSRNSLLEGGLASSWDQITGKINDAGISTKDFQSKLEETAKAGGADVEKLVEKHGSLENAFRKGELGADIMAKSLTALSTSQMKSIGYTEKFEAKLSQAVEEGGYSVDELVKKHGSLEEAFKAGKVPADILARTIDSLSDKQLKEMGYTDEQVDKMRALGEMANTSTGPIKKLLDTLTRDSGRENIIQGLWNAFDGLANIINPIKEAFREIFPPMTVDTLYSFTAKFENLTAKFKEFTAAHGPQIKSIFTGIFSVVDIGWTVIKKLAGAIVEIVSNFTGFTGGVLDAAASVGEWLVGLRDSIKEADILGRAIDKVKGFLVGVIDGFKKFMTTSRDAMSPDNYGGFLGVMQDIWDVISKIGSAAGKVLSALGQGFFDAFSKIETGDIFALFNGGLFAGILLKIEGFADGVSGAFQELLDAFKPAEGGGGFFASIKETLEGVKDSLQAYQEQLKAGTLLKIASAIGILAGAILVLSTIDAEALGSALSAITVLFGELIGSMVALDKFTGQMKGAIGTAAIMTGMSVAILILSSAMKKLSELNWEGIAKGLVGVGGLMTELVLFLKTAKFDGKMMGTATGIVIMSSAMLILANAVEDFGGMDWEVIGKGLTAIGGLLAEIALFTNLTGSASHVVSTGVAMVALGAAMKIFASAVKDFAAMSWEEIGRGLAAMGGALAEVAIAMMLMPKNMLSMGVGLAAVSGAMIVLANAMSNFSGMSWDEILRGLAAMGGVLLELSIALNLMNGTLAGSAALVVAAGALALLAPVMQTLGSMTLGEIGTALLTMAGAFTAIGIAGALLTPVVPSILALAGSMALFGASIIGIGAGLSLIGVGLTAVGTGFTTLAVGIGGGATAIVAGLSTIVLGIATLIPQVCIQLANGIVAFAQAIAAGVPEIIVAIGTILDALLNFIVEYIPKIVDAGLKTIIGFLQGISDNIQQVVEVAAEVVINFINGIANCIGAIIQAGINLMVKFINGMANGIRTNSQLIIGAILNLMDAVFGAIASCFGGAIKKGKELLGKIMEGIKSECSKAGTSAKEIGKNIIEGLKNGITSKAKSIATAAKNAVSGALKAAKDFLGINSPSKAFAELGMGIDEGLVKGMSDYVGIVKNASVGVGDSLVTAMQDALDINSPSKVMRDAVGRHVIEGIAEGITEDMTAEEAAAKKAENITKAFRTEFDKLDLDEKTLDLEHQLWLNTDGKNADEATKLAKENERIADEINLQTERLRLANYEYKVTQAEFGDNAEVTQQAYNKLLQVKVKMGELAAESDAIAAKQLESSVSATEALKEQMEVERDVLELEKETSDLEHQLWEARNSDIATDEELKVKKIEKLNSDMVFQAEKVQMASDLYESAIKEFGDASTESREAYNDLLEEQIKMQELSNQLTELTTAASEEVVSAYDASIEALEAARKQLELEESTSELQHQLWEKTAGRNADESTLLAQDAARLAEEMTAQSKRVQLANDEYQANLKEFGETAEATHESYNKLLQEQIKMEELNIESDELKVKQLEAEKTVTKELKKKLDAEMEILDAERKTADLEHELWKATYGNSATETELISKQAEQINSDMLTQSKKVQAANDVYQSTIKEFGETSTEARSAYNDLLAEQIEMAKLSNQLDSISTQTFNANTSALNAARKQIELESKRDDLENELWLSGDGRGATAMEKAAHEVEQLTKDVEFQKQRVQLADEEYQDTLAQFGEGSAEALESYNALLEEEIKMNKLSSELNEATANELTVTENARRAYAQWMAENGKILREAGFSEERIRAAAEKASGYKLPAPIVTPEEKEKAKASMTEACEGVIDAAKEALDIHSPSKVFEEIGAYAIAGFIKGLMGGEETSLEAASSITDYAMTIISTAVSRIQEAAANTDMTIQPRIAPVLDMSNLQNGSLSIGDIAAKLSVDIANSTAASAHRAADQVSNAIDRMRTATLQSHAEITTAITTIRGDIASLGSAIRSMKVHMDSGPLVGSLITKIDTGLGQIASHKGRG